MKNLLRSEKKLRVNASRNCTQVLEEAEKS